MADPLTADDPPSNTQPHTADFDSSFLIPPVDVSLGPQYLTGKDGVAGGDHDDAVSLGDLEFDFSFNDVCLHFSDDFLNPTQLPQSDVQPGPDPCFHQVPNFDQFPHAVFKSSPEMRHLSGDEDQSLNHSAVLTSQSPEMDANQISGYLNVPSPESNGSNSGSSEICVADVKGLNCPSPECQVSGNCGSNAWLYLDNYPFRSVSSSPNSKSNSDNIFIRVGVVDQKIKLENLANKHNVVNSSLLKRKKEAEDSTVDDNGESGISKFIKSNCNLNDNNSSDNVGGLSEEEEKRKTRLMRNRESAQLSRQRKKHYVEELEDKVRNMHSTIQDLNAKISFFTSENAMLRQQVGSGGSGAPPPLQLAPPPPPGMYPHPAMMYPWMHCAPPYMMKVSQVPLVPIPKLKPQQATQSPKVSRKVESNKKEGAKTKKVAGVSFLGLLFFIMLFGGLVPMVNVRYGGVKKAVTGAKNYVGDGFHETHRGRVLMANGTETYGNKEFNGNHSVHCGQGDHNSGKEPSVDEFACMRDGSEPLIASLYVPRNDKLVKIDGNLIIHSVLASEKAMTSNGKESGETGLAVAGGLSPCAPVAKKSGRHPPPLRALGSNSTEKDNLKSTATDGKLQQWFREGLAGPMLSSGMCIEVFQFDVSSAIVPATRNISEKQNQNSTHVRKGRNRRILRVPLPESSLNISNNDKEQYYSAGNSQKEKNSSSMVVSVLVDPREIGDGDADSVMGTKSLSRIFVVVLIDSVKYVTYSCMLPFMGSAPVVTA